MLLPGGAQTFALLQAQTRPVFFVCAPKIEGDCRQSLVNTRPPVARPHALHRLLIALDQARQNRSTLVAWLIALRLSADSRNSTLADMEFPTGGHQISP